MWFWYQPDPLRPPEIVVGPVVATTTTTTVAIDPLAAATTTTTVAIDPLAAAAAVVVVVVVNFLSCCIGLVPWHSLCLV